MYGSTQVKHFSAHISFILVVSNMGRSRDGRPSPCCALLRQHDSSLGHVRPSSHGLREVGSPRAPNRSTLIYDPWRSSRVSSSTFIPRVSCGNMHRSRRLSFPRCACSGLDRQRTQGTRSLRSSASSSTGWFIQDCARLHPRPRTDLLANYHHLDPEHQVAQRADRDHTATAELAALFASTAVLGHRLEHPP